MEKVKVNSKESINRNIIKTKQLLEELKEDIETLKLHISNAETILEVNNNFNCDFEIDIDFEEGLKHIRLF